MTARAAVPAGPQRAWPQSAQRCRRTRRCVGRWRRPLARKGARSLAPRPGQQQHHHHHVHLLHGGPAWPRRATCRGRARCPLRHARRCSASERRWYWMCLCRRCSYSPSYGSGASARRTLRTYARSRLMSGSCALVCGVLRAACCVLPAAGLPDVPGKVPGGGARVQK